MIVRAETAWITARTMRLRFELSILNDCKVCVWDTNKKTTNAETSRYQHVLEEQNCDHDRSPDIAQTDTSCSEQIGVL